VLLRLLAHQIELVAREVVARPVVAATSAPGRTPEELLPQVVCGPAHATRERFEVRDREHDAAAGLRDAGHLGDGLPGPIEVVHRALADHGIEAGVGEGQRIGPAAQPGGVRPGLVGREQERHVRHALRRLRAEDPRTPHGQGQGILTDTARHVEDSSARGRPGAIQRHPGHAIEQELAVRRLTRRNDVAHVAIEVHDAHGAAR